MSSGKEIKKIYIVGVEGAGTSALAQIYKSLGHDVSGSDEGDHFYGDVLEKSGIKVFQEFDAKNVPDGIDFAVYSTSLEESNPELVKIKKRKIRLLKYSQALGEIFNEKVGIAVCGTHGKTTTTAMLAQTLEECGKDPLALVGSKVRDWKNNVLLGKGEYFVAEADEYQNKLKLYDPWFAILTSVSYDHPDFFKSVEDYEKVFSDFVKKIPKNGFLVAWGDSSYTMEVSKSADCRVVRYGFLDDNDYVIRNKKGGKFEVFRGEDSLGIFNLKIPGDYNKLNACSVIALCNELNLDMEKAKNSLSRFSGTARRFEQRGEFNGAKLIDDYAHHPDEIRATLGAAKEKYGEKNIIVIFQPHTFSRTEALLQEFSQSFEDADLVVILDIYGAREKQGNVSSKNLVELINKYFPGKARYVPTMDEAREYVSNNIGQDDVLITMGAGDVWNILEKLKEKM